VAGNRRYAALKKLGHKKAKCTINLEIKNMADLGIANLSENIQRDNICPIEEGRFVDFLVEKHDMSIDEIAVRLAVNKRRVSDAKFLYTKLSKKWRDKVVYSGKSKNIPGKVTSSVAVKILKSVENGNVPRRYQDKLFGLSAKNELPEIKLNSLLRSVGNGMSFEDALEHIETVTHIRLDLPVFIKEKDKLCKKYNTTPSELVYRTLYGELDGIKFTRPQ
jgi:ParB family chromosome partitioning protein